MTGAYLAPAADRDLDPFDWVPEASRRGRATTVYAALRSLGREGLADLVDRCCALARRMAGGWAGVAAGHQGRAARRQVGLDADAIAVELAALHERGLRLRRQPPLG